MHLQKSPEVLRYSEPTTEVSTEGDTQSQKQGSVPMRQCSQDFNAIEIPIPQEKDSRTILNVILTSWVLLLQRYQRDSFDRFSWGVNDKDLTHILFCHQLELTKLETVAQLRGKIQSIWSSDDSVSPTIFLRDGINNEV